MHDALYLGLAANDRIKLAVLGSLGEVAAELIKHQGIGTLTGTTGAATSAGASTCTDWTGALTIGGAALLLSTFVAGQQLDNLLAHAWQVGAELGQHLRGDAIALANETQQQELSTDVLVSHLQALTQGELKNLLGTWSKGDVAGVWLATLADDFLDLTADILQGNTHGFQCLGSDAFAFMDKAEQDVLGADVIVVKHACFFLRQNDDAASTIGKPLEHDSPILSLLMCHPL